MAPISSRAHCLNVRVFAGNFSDMLIFDEEGALQARHAAGTREPLEGPMLQQMVAKL